MGFFKRIMGNEKSGNSSDAVADPGDKNHWQAVSSERTAAFRAEFGAFPDDIQKLTDLTGVWPGGGLVILPASRMTPAGNLSVYATFGLTNPDMPTTVKATAVATTTSADDRGRVESTKSTLSKKESSLPKTPGRSGYGHEVMVIAESGSDWPLWILQWAAKAELIGDAGLLDRVEKYAGLTIGQVEIGSKRFVNLLFTKALPPYPQSIELSTGNAAILIATVITDDELAWAMQNGRNALLPHLKKAGYGQVSVLGRASSIPEPTEAEIASVTSREMAEGLAKRGGLLKALLFPSAFGGADIPPNTLFLPASAAVRQEAIVNEIRQLASTGEADSLTVDPEYRGTSVVPAALLYKVSKGQSEPKVVRLSVW